MTKLRLDGLVEQMHTVFNQNGNTVWKSIIERLDSNLYYLVDVENNEGGKLEEEFSFIIGIIISNLDLASSLIALSRYMKQDNELGTELNHDFNSTISTEKLDEAANELYNSAIYQCKDVLERARNAKDIYKEVGSSIPVDYSELEYWISQFKENMKP